jgi:NAD+ synthase
MYKCKRSLFKKMKSPEKVVHHIVTWLKDYLENSKMNGFVVGVSGGIDSAVTSTLCSLTGAPVLCLEMEIHQDSHQVSRANEHIQWLKKKFENVSHHNISLSGVFDNFVESVPATEMEDEQLLSLANTRARLRMSTLYYFAALHRYLVAGTGNKVEDFGVGFYTKYGDGGVDLSPIADLLKSQVYEVARSLDIAESIQKAAPTDGLWSDNRTDEEQMGANYNELEWAMEELEKNPSLKNLNKKQLDLIEIYLNFNRQNQHKMNPIPVCQIPSMLLK